MTSLIATALRRIAADLNHWADQADAGHEIPGEAFHTARTRLECQEEAQRINLHKDDAA